jgi:hypothetical protein
MNDNEKELNVALKMDVIARWMHSEWIQGRASQSLKIVRIPDACVHAVVLDRFEREKDLEEGMKFLDSSSFEAPVTLEINDYSHSGEMTYHTGAYIYRFGKPDEEPFEVLVVAAFYSDEGYIVALAAVPEELLTAWMAFSKECQRLVGSLSPTPEVVIVGGRSASFVPTVRWEDIILPPHLKDDLLNDVQSFFTKGVEIYKRLNLKPFRKLLLAGVPGTGKTMLCSALAKWALDREYLVIYISSADRDGSTFWKIEQALGIASRSDHPTLILLEELDAYLHEEEKALVLNVLDGSEALVNDKGSLLIATTNFPEAIDQRVMKRPGRLDRIFIIPEVRSEEDAEKMLRQYLGDMWQEGHASVAGRLVGYPGAFIREVAIFALTHVAYEDLGELTTELLETSFKRLREQIDERDNFLTQRMGLAF